MKLSKKEQKLHYAFNHVPRQHKGERAILKHAAIQNEQICTNCLEVQERLIDRKERSRDVPMMRTAIVRTQPLYFKNKTPLKRFKKLVRRTHTRLLEGWTQRGAAGLKAAEEQVRDGGNGGDEHQKGRWGLNRACSAVIFNTRDTVPRDFSATKRAWSRGRLTNPRNPFRPIL